MTDEAAELEARDEAHYLENDDLGLVDCDRCDGRGSYHDVEPMLYGTYWVICNKCGGKGRVEAKR